MIIAHLTFRMADLKQELIYFRSLYFNDRTKDRLLQNQLKEQRILIYIVYQISHMENRTQRGREFLVSYRHLATLCL